MTAPSREVREAAERAAVEELRRPGVVVMGTVPRANALDYGVTLYERGHADATAAHAARVGVLEMASRNLLVASQRLCGARFDRDVKPCAETEEALAVAQADLGIRSRELEEALG